MNSKTTTHRGPFENRTNGPYLITMTPSTAKPHYQKSDLENNTKPYETRQQGRWKVPYKPAEPKKQLEVIDCPLSKQQLRDFMKPLKDLESQGFYPVFHAACDKLKNSPQTLHWRVFVELADLAKRDNKIDEARALFAMATQIQPYAHQSWLEYSKLEEECGRIELSRKLLILGLHFCPLSDQLAVKFIKTEEKNSELDAARMVLSSLKSYPLDKNWKILMEGALMEARSGSIEIARSIFNHLMAQCGNFGAIFLEAVKFEERWGKDIYSALDNCEKGLARNPRYGPLWFSYLRLLDKIEFLQSQGSAARIPNHEVSRRKLDLIAKGEESLTKELVWKLYLEYALGLERAGKLEDCRRYMKDAVVNCPDNLRWKAWMVGARIELKAGNYKIAMNILNQSLNEVPCKQKSIVLVEMSKAYELIQNKEKARELMIEACENSKQDWKVHLEYITMEMRNSDFSRATQIAKDSIVKYSNTGRLWSALIQLQHTDRKLIEQKLHFKGFLLALKEVPKSGEVWCEGARLRLNPFTEYYDLDSAEDYLNYAIQFTPQYGDSFIEMLRVYMLKGTFEKISELKRLCINADPNYGMLWFFCKQNPLEGPAEVWKRAKKLVKEELCAMKLAYDHPKPREELYIDCMWSGLTQANWTYSRSDNLDLNGRWRLIYGSENITI
ncbi:unnamed protein product [Blepharisma stoltei]|uniref:Uncharacterized protein n=1 Tax=Blepharisma stoltei TaxID=1481888 RepID=A0AAU9KHM3_9CILI|nr:unnamed protein product [Blepharisma stoltei]